MGEWPIVSGGGCHSAALSQGVRNHTCSIAFPFPPVPVRKHPRGGMGSPNLSRESVKLVASTGLLEKKERQEREESEGIAAAQATRDTVAAEIEALLRSKAQLSTDDEAALANLQRSIIWLCMHELSVHFHHFIRVLIHFRCV